MAQGTGSASTKYSISLFLLLSKSVPLCLLGALRRYRLCGYKLGGYKLGGYKLGGYKLSD